jgi:hypothetical protein
MINVMPTSMPLCPDRKTLSYASISPLLWRRSFLCFQPA